MSGGAASVPENLVEALDHLEADGLVAFPTETVWGLAARASSQRAVERLLSFKGRDRDRPISVMIDEPATLGSLGVSPDPRLLAIAKAFWPGPLTLVIPCPAHGCLAPGIAGPTGAVGVRCSDHPLASMLVRHALDRNLGLLTATSFNRSGETPVQTHSEAVLLAKSQTREQPVLVLRAGPHDAGGGAPSTVLDLAASEPRVLREGAIGEQALARVLDGLAPGQ
jgi:L-threonylcarbamoyladenylate synthase